MTSNFLMLATPVFAFLAVVATSAFTFYRIMRYGRVFNWPPIPEKSGPPPVIRHGDQ